METITKTNTVVGTAVALSIISLILAMGGSPDVGNWYYGIDNQSNIICGPIQCDKLSAQNDLGISSRCYFINEDNKSTYKICSEGWVKSENIQKEEICKVKEIKLKEDSMLKIDLIKDKDTNKEVYKVYAK